MALFPACCSFAAAALLLGLSTSTKYLEDLDFASRLCSLSLLWFCCLFGLPGLLCRLGLSDCATSRLHARLVSACLVLSCLVLSGLVLHCLALSCIVLSCLVLSCLVCFVCRSFNHSLQSLLLRVSANTVQDVVEALHLNHIRSYPAAGENVGQRRKNPRSQPLDLSVVCVHNSLRGGCFSVLSVPIHAHVSIHVSTHICRVNPTRKHRRGITNAVRILDG